jgi:DNA-binding YbaB/EbfC family protein
MKDLSSLMKQAQAMQQKLGEAQEKVTALLIDGQAGGGVVRVRLKGSGDLVRVEIDEALMAPGEAEMVVDLVVAAHADAKRQLDAAQTELMKQAAGPFAGMPGMPKF